MEPFQLQLLLTLKVVSISCWCVHNSLDFFADMATTAATSQPMATSKTTSLILGVVFGACGMLVIAFTVVVVLVIALCRNRRKEAPTSTEHKEEEHSIPLSAPNKSQEAITVETTQNTAYGSFSAKPDTIPTSQNKAYIPHTRAASTVCTEQNAAYGAAFTAEGDSKNGIPTSQNEAYGSYLADTQLDAEHDYQCDDVYDYVLTDQL